MLLVGQSSDLLATTPQTRSNSVKLGQTRSNSIKRGQTRSNAVKRGQAPSNSFGSRCKIPRCRTANNAKCANCSTYGFGLRLFLSLLRVGQFSDLLATTPQTRSNAVTLGQTRSYAVKRGQTRSNSVKRGQTRSYAANAVKLGQTSSSAVKHGQTRQPRSNSFGSQCKSPRCHTANNAKCATYSTYGFVLRLFSVCCEWGNSAIS